MSCKITGIALTLLLSGATGCIREDLSGCRPGVGVVYEYSLNTEQENLFGEEVGKVTTYAFDEEGIFVGSYSDAGEHLTNDFRMVLPLPDGVYTLVVWAGPLGDYIVGDNSTSDFSEPEVGKTRIGDFMLKYRSDELTVGSKVDDLYHGIIEGVVSDYTRSNTYTVSLTKNTSDVSVTLVDTTPGTTTDGSAAGRADDRFEVYCTSANGRYNADNTLGDGALTLTYTPYDRTDEGQESRQTMSMMRLMADGSCQSVLVVHDKEQNTDIYRKPLVDAIMENPGFATQEDLDRADQFDFRIKLEMNVVAEVWINGWKIVEITPGL